ncbi:hypothetical protein BGZ63DRAFT_388794 [Mariannaea sp. PMI_226]|nr:hypothetical protein BGZ63DRAFT_388794 [Mariannaea sp. PMI_226]
MPSKLTVHLVFQIPTFWTCSLITALDQILWATTPFPCVCACVCECMHALTQLRGFLCAGLSMYLTGCC